MYNPNPAHSYPLDALLRLAPPPPPADFAEFWQPRYTRTLQVQPRPRLSYNSSQQDFEIYDLNYRSSGDFEIGGWALIPRHAPVTRALVVGHGYGGRDAPDLHLPVPGAALLFPCFRGLSRSRQVSISDNPQYHVLHDLDKKDRYILGACVEDLWLAVSVLLLLFPATRGHIGYLGTSFGGGIGALALPWDTRIARAHLNVPSFGHQPIRLQLPTWGSASAVQRFHRAHPELHVLETLAYYDAANAAHYIRQPLHIAAALADPMVTPPGQFAIYNSLSSKKHLFILEQGHSDYPNRAAQEQALLSELKEFFAGL